MVKTSSCSRHSIKPINKTLRKAVSAFHECQQVAAAAAEAAAVAAARPTIEPVCLTESNFRHKRLKRCYTPSHANACVMQFKSNLINALHKRSTE